jgi:putative aminopeptidase FrvX
MLTHQKILEEILSQPTAPYREEHIQRTLEKILKENGVPYFIDPIGNILAGVASKAEYLKAVKTKTKDPLRIAIAHMDHPGFHGVKWLSQNELAFDWLGGSATQSLKGRKVWLADHTGRLGLGEILTFEPHESGRGILSGTLKVTEWSTHTSSKTIAPPSKTQARSVYGSFGFRAPFWQEDDLIYTNAADDLVGVFAIVSTLIDLHGKKSAKKSSAKKPVKLIGLLSRAEEVGFIGTIGHLELGWMKNPKRPLMVLSLETSRTQSGAEIGKGPVVRLGDRMNVFNSGLTYLFTQLAQKVLPGRFQRRIMDGGSCEGSAALAYGLPTIAISVPLGNYHNQSLEGGPDAGPPNSSAPEYVSLSDVEGMRKLIDAIIREPLEWSDPYRSIRLKFKNSLKSAKKLLSRRV